MWSADALAEHTSIASFARFTLQLLALDAPSDLLSRSQQAGKDEMEHARLCFQMQIGSSCGIRGLRVRNGFAI